MRGDAEALGARGLPSSRIFTSEKLMPASDEQLRAARPRDVLAQPPPDVARPFVAEAHEAGERG